MKATASISLLIILQLVNNVAALNMNKDFLTGFETGLFLRSNTQHFNEYDCPSPL